MNYARKRGDGKAGGGGRGYKVIHITHPLFGYLLVFRLQVGSYGILPL